MKEKTLSTKTVFKGRLLRVDVVQIETEDGARSDREVVRHSGATAVLTQLPDGRFVLVRQYRKPVEREMIEIVAGVLKPGEDPDRCAVREVKEETGYTVRELVKLGTIFPSPGYTTEKLHLYFARLFAEQGGLEQDEDERVDTVYLTAEEIRTLIRKGEMKDGKTLAAWLLYLTRVLDEA